ncbi:helix-turn-helix domain-containing protein [Halorubrum sp. CBA1125]|uniref:helix-turn-helix domain-containing protein n=1 Tax=Halorubrum sp. CBA1125 TaxID=2668072 RepID=UPI0012E944A3|nr:helix-turn-helix domain-containing protein [Halorubrum sp. CBA1125]MUW13364.1 helix-turn-helix domain-containing protein [Halorubrum sp. CBA1125]
MSTPDGTNGGKTIGSLETAFTIVELVAQHGEVTPSGLTDEIDYSRSTIHYYLRTLEKHRFLTRGDGGYRLGFRFLHYGNRAVRGHELARTARAR